MQVYVLTDDMLVHTALRRLQKNNQPDQKYCTWHIIHKNCQITLLGGPCLPAGSSQSIFNQTLSRWT